VIRLEAEPGGRVRVIGSLQEPALKLLAEAVARGARVLDLSEVDQADESAVRLLAGLAPERCTLAACPTWLSLWIERVRQGVKPQG
jgi:hypothetical protein